MEILMLAKLKRTYQELGAIDNALYILAPVLTLFSLAELRPFSFARLSLFKWFFFKR
jgi:hypothetical protein